jgi:hypothetical protein
LVTNEMAVLNAVSTCMPDAPRASGRCSWTRIIRKSRRKPATLKASTEKA